jgi:hydroxymethylpyrimidine/phosphomethylpyrimidine kinase
VRGVSTHGTGCTYSAAIAAHCARGLALPDAVRQAKQFITQAIARSRRIGRHFVLGW